MLSWCYGLALGAERFEHFTRYRRDRLLAELIGAERFGSPDTSRRIFLRFSYREVTDVSERLMRFSLARLRPILMGHTLDLDSTILCHYGAREGSLKGYILRSPGKDRIRAAMKNCGYNTPAKRITINLASADIKKEGSAYCSRLL